MRDVYYNLADQLVELIENQKLQQWKVAKMLDVPIWTLQKWLKKHNIRTQRVGPRTGVACKGGRLLRKGYDYIFLPKHPFSNKKGYILESHIVMEQKLSRYLEKGEVVHHLDKNPRNNHPDNLILFESNADHLRHELTGKCPRWSREGWEIICKGHPEWISTRGLSKSYDDLLLRANVRQTS